MDVKGLFPTFTRTLPAPPGITGLGARVEVAGTRAIASAWQPAVLADGVWTVVLEEPTAPVTRASRCCPAPCDPGSPEPPVPYVPPSYVLVWRTPDPEPPEYEAFVPLTVTGG